MSRRRVAAGLLGGLGAGVLAYGVAGLLTSEVRPANWARFLAYGLVGHDVVIGAVIAAGATALAVAVRRLPARLRAAVSPPVVGGLIVSGSLALIAVPLLTGIGRDPVLPSALPLDYWSGLTRYLAVIWLVTVALAAGRAARVYRSSRRRGPGSTARDAHR